MKVLYIQNYQYCGDDMYLIIPEKNLSPFFVYIDKKDWAEFQEKNVFALQVKEVGLTFKNQYGEYPQYEVVDFFWNGGFDKKAALNAISKGKDQEAFKIIKGVRFLHLINEFQENEKNERMGVNSSFEKYVTTRNKLLFKIIEKIQK